MFKRSLTAVALLAMLGSSAYANETPIEGNVQSLCTIYTDTAGVYGLPTPDKLTTSPTDGGVKPVIRFDIAQASYYKARISYPDSFTTSPALDDTVAFTGSVSVAEVTDALMSDYDTNKVTYNNTTEYDLTIAGSTWFAIESVAEYGVNKAFPAGTYRAVVTAECIAQ
jgi:hypothetical protein